MTNPNNGATLEDCHSNFFALTDLCGIKWRRLVSDGCTGTGHPHHSFGPLDDPVLASFARCLASDILCVWRRSPNSKQSLPSSALDPFQPQNSHQPFLSNPGSNVPSGPTAPSPLHMTHLPTHPHMMPPHMGMGMPGHINSHHIGPPFPTGPKSHHGLSTQTSIHQSLYNNTNHNHPSLNGPKELWIFWYGEEPDLNGLVNPQLLESEADQGSWESGLSYECRTLLFKALHNLIERCLLAREFVRIGKWFIQPCDDNQRIGVKNFPMQLTFSFSFFVHGESTVCMSVDVRQHPSIRRINKNHLMACQSPNQTLPVILAPHGLAGTLTGVGYRLNEPGTHKILEEWKHFYPVQSALKPSTYDTSTTPQSGPYSSPSHQPLPNHQQPTTIPPVLEVVVGGVRMRYPSCYVLCTELDDPPRALDTSVQLSFTATPKSRLPYNSNDSEAAACPNGPPPNKPQGSHTLLQEVDHAAGILPERVWQESVLCSNLTTKPAESTNPSGEPPTTNHVDNVGQWDFTDPNKKTVCTCSNFGFILLGKHRCKRISGSKNMGHMSGSQSTKGGTKFRRSTFHKRTALQMAQVENWANLWDLAEDSSANSQGNNNVGASAKGSDAQHQSHNNQSSINRNNNTPGTPLGGPPSYKTGPGSIAPGGVGSEGPGASPASIAPSPLATPRSQPASVPQQEPPMPTLSPQPAGDKLPAATPENSAPKSVSSSSNQVFSPLTGSFDGAKTEPGTDPITITEKLNQSTTISENVSNSTVNFVACINGQSNAGLTRPVLPSKEYEGILAEEDSNQPSDIIYDYSAMQAWLNHPVKRMKTNDGAIKTTMYSWGMGMRKPPDVEPSMVNGPHDKNMSGKGSSDPYEFNDDNHQAPAVNMDSLKRKEGIKEEEKSPYCPNETGNNAPKVPPGNLFTIEGLQPSFRDLDQIFDNSDTSSDENFQAPTPPGSNKPAGSSEDTGLIALSSSSTKNKCLGILRPEELSKMFPTPPSHEHNPIASPCGLQPETPLMDSISDSCIRRNPESYPGLGSPPDEPIEDWSYVYKSPTVYKLMGSSKYAPLSVLPSQQNPPLVILPVSVYKPSWQTPESLAPTNIKEKAQPPQQPQHPPGNQLQQRPHAPTPTPHQQHSSIGNLGPTIPNNQMHLRPGLSPISPVPNSIRGPQFDLGSPPSNNMYLKQNVQHSHGNHPHPGHHHMYGSRGLEAHALVVNLSLSDSVINLFRDHNFDSCTMCVCNAGIKVVGNIRGSEVGLYIPDLSPEEDQVRCNCGFSASANRRLAHRSGLFYEDECEITTPALAPLAIPGDEWYEKKKPSFLLLDPKYPNANAISADKDATNASTILDAVPPYLLEMLREQCLLMYGKSAASRFTGDVIHNRWTERTYNYLEYLDGSRAALTALEHGRTVMLEASGRSGFPRLPEDSMPLKNSTNFMHKWPYLWARGPQSSQDVMQVMRALHPLIQDAVHAKAWDAQYTVSGPLTWRQFHRLAGRGTDDRCEPQPIPSILVGSEKDWVALSPLAIKFWEKLLLEPYAYPRDVAYIVVSPENDFILQKVRTYFRELSSMYEVCQLGRHCPISKVLRDGILRVGRNAAIKLAAEPVDEWFSMLPDIPTSSTLKLYAQVCRYYLAPQLASISLDQSLLDCSTQNNVSRPTTERPTPSPKMPPPTSDHPSISGSTQGPATPKSEFEQEFNSKEGITQENLEDDERDPPALVIYIVEPFGFGSDSKDLHRMANLGLLRCYASMLSFVPENIKNNITLQVISLEDIMNIGNPTLDTRFKHDQLRAAALTIYSQCRRLLIHQNNVKSLTGFGPAAASELFLKSKDEKKKGAYKLFTPPYVLAPTKEKVSEGVEWLGGIQGHTVGGMVSSGNSLSVGPSFCPNASSVLYVAYCISEDQRWLLASATDDRGELLETTTINIYVPNRSKRRKASARKHGLQKLMDFMLGIMSTSVHPWRLVVGRLGRVGHGELESWSTLLSRKSLLRASNQLKDSCRQCSLQYPADTPCVLSACLVSLEPDSCLRLMPDQFTPDERFGVNSGTSTTLSTPQDVSCTHILVFPTSATTQSSQTAFQEQHINGPDLGDEDLLFINVNEDMSDGIDGMQDLQLGDIFSWADTGPGVPSPVGSPRRDSTSQPGSPGVGASGRQSPFQSGGQGRAGGRGDAGDELGTLLQQPLALGYMVSTAPSGTLPHWFWSSCPQRSTEKSSGVFLKSALHLHSHSVLHNLDDLLQQQTNAKQHPLDSQFTTDVLRFVLEGYNALSWLCLDPTTHDRRSCLPVHIQKLLQLYYTISALV